MRGILVLAASALLAGLLIVPSGCSKKSAPPPVSAMGEKKEAPAPPAPATENEKEVPVASPAEKQETPSAAEVPAGNQPASEGEPVPPSAAALAPGELDPGACSDKIAVEEARVRREVLPKLRTDQEANAQVVEWTTGTAKQLQGQEEKWERKRREEHYREYVACRKALSSAKAERDPVCVAYVTKDVTACDRVENASVRNHCVMLVRQAAGGAAPMEGGLLEPPIFGDQAMKPRMAVFDPDEPWCHTLSVMALRESPPGGKNQGLGLPENMEPGRPQPLPGGMPGMESGHPQPLPGGMPGMKPLPGSGPDGPPRPGYTPRMWKTLDDCEVGGLRWRFGKPLDDTACRKMIWEKSVLPAAEGKTELRLKFVNPFDSPAQCSVAISVKGAESETSQKAKLSFGPSQTKVQSLFFLAEPGDSFSVKPDCTWETPSVIDN